MLVFLVNPCDSYPCKNGGTCENDEDTFTCNCTEKFEGPTCDAKGFSNLPVLKVKGHINLKISKI